MTATHDGRIAFGRFDPTKTYPISVHPVIARHQETGRKLIYVNRGFTSHINELPPAESAKVLEFLYQHVESPLWQCRFHWRKHSIAFWDNRCTQHYAVWDYRPQVRSGWRVQIANSAAADAVTDVREPRRPRSRRRPLVYRDPAIFARELERIWSTVWVYLGHESELPNHGDYLRRPIGLQPVVLVRGEHGTIRAFYNRCRHRGNLLCLRERGNAPLLRCPYHGWSYASSGALVAPTFEDGYAEPLDRDAFGLVPIPRPRLLSRPDLRQPRC